MKTPPFTPPILATLAVACTILLSALPAPGQQGRASAALQADTFVKVFPFDRRLGDLANVTVLILRPAPAGAWSETLDELERAFSDLGIQSRQVGIGELAEGLATTTVVYLVPETASDEVLAAVADAGALSISGDYELAEAGRVAVALDPRGARPEIVVNLARVEQERHEFSAQLLRVARVIREDPGAAATGPTRAPRLVHMDEPEYPSMARRMRVQGEVVVRIRVSETGQVEEVELIHGIAQNVGLNEAALDVASRATFEPALRDGQPVAEWIIRRFRFTL